MTPELVLEILDHSMIALVKLSLPMLLTGLVVGIVISIFQALTQIQETTLTFVPKMIALFIVLAFCMPFIGATLSSLTMELYSHIVDRQ
ncbi:flagellar biosynthesis protein FliQ [Candidatus Odyssella acanthamoebae]|uniref:Flagellar biosynthetic protein FliQ n=1 Tax=Candidatus Odyssella acanthamoebae TaxID=91604 RepID=A0A077ARM4_9PROT|nr:flagellar biosynthesis protein FliQ [Candidatus Paracaedibacter acanthamoebae]AIK95852.1 flagellar biosynthesis protein FliQ [Candidatus Paracaedibacter acanthamoebae]